MFGRHVARGAKRICLLAGLFVAALSSAHAKDDFTVSTAQMQALGVTVQRLVRPAAIQGMGYPAQVVLPPSREQVVSAPVDGVVERVLVGPNDTVRPGQPLLRLVSPEYGERQLKLMEAAAKARLSQTTLTRERALFSEGIIAERRVQEAELAQGSDLAHLQQAVAALRLTGTDEPTLKRIQAGGKLDEGLSVPSRIAGAVLAVDIKPGQRVKEADPLMRLADLRELWLDIQLPGSSQAQEVSMAGEIIVVARDAVAMPLSVGALVSDSQTVTLRAHVTRGADRLRAGEIVQAQVPFVSSVAGWAVPLSAIARQDVQAYVFVRTPSGFVATPVTVVSSAGQSVQVTGKLIANQEIAVSSVIALKAAWLGKSGGS